VNEGKERLEKEAKELKEEAQKEVMDLLEAKNVALIMQNLLYQYESKLKLDQLSQLKLADEVTLKNLLKEKLHREIQGFRTSADEYKELEKVNPNDIAQIITQIKQKLSI
jgi:hypothetical protein